MSQNQRSGRMLGWPVYLALALFALVVVAFIVVVVTLPSASAPTPAPISTSAVSDSTGEALPISTDTPRVAALLALGKAVDGESVINYYGCHVCHTTQVAGVGPSWVGIAARAATRRPSMSAATYLYESITAPSAYIVPGYQNVMPGDFGQRMSDQELADVIAYLLTPNAR